MLFERNSTVCFIGDSITHNNTYVSHIMRYYAENHSELNVKMYNCGVSGGTCGSGLKYLEDDVLPHKPDYATVMFGINDSRRDILAEPRTPERFEKLKQRYDLYKNNLTALCDKLLENNIKVILFTPPPFAEYEPHDSETLPGGHALMLGYSAFVKELGARYNLPVYDCNGYLTAAMQSETLYGPDRVHPSTRGQYYIAKGFIDFQGEDMGEEKPLPVSMNEWRAYTAKLRDIYAVEWMVVIDYKMPYEKKIALVKESVESGAALKRSEYFLRIESAYLENKPKQKEIEEKIKELTENFKL